MILNELQLNLRQYDFSDRREGEKINTKIRKFNRAGEAVLRCNLPAESETLFWEYKNFKGNCSSREFLTLQNQVRQDTRIKEYVRRRRESYNCWEDLKKTVYDLSRDSNFALLQAAALVAIKEYSDRGTALSRILLWNQRILNPPESSSHIALQNQGVSDPYERIRQRKATNRMRGATLRAQHTLEQQQRQQQPAAARRR